MNDSIHALGATRKRRKGQCCQLSTYNSPNFSNLLSGHLENGVSTQIGHLLFSEKFKQTQFVDLGACPEIWKSQYTEILLNKNLFS